MWLVLFTFIHLDYQLYKTGELCFPKEKYGHTFVGYKSSVDKCYQKCKGGTFFDYHIKGRMDATCNSVGCFCACYTESDDDGGCLTESFPQLNLYRIKSKLTVKYK